jgi:hypothetical protein
MSLTINHLEFGFKRQGVFAKDTPSFGEVNLEAGALLGIVVFGTFELDDLIQDILALGGAASIVAPASMVDEQNADPLASQLQELCLHRVPGIRIVFTSTADQGRDIIDHDKLDAHQMGL